LAKVGYIEKGLSEEIEENKNSKRTEEIIKQNNKGGAEYLNGGRRHH